MRLILTSLFSIFFTVAFSQENSTIDSLQSLILNENDSAKLTFLQIELGQNYRYENDFISAQNEINHAADYIQKNQPRLQAKVLYELGMTHYLWGNNTEAIQYFNASLLVVEGLIIKDEISVYVILGNISSEFDNYNESIRTYRMALEKSEEIDDGLQNEYSYIHNNLGIVYMKKKVFDSSRIEHNLSLEIRLKKGNSFALGQTYNNIGMLNFQMGEFDSAMFYFQKGLEFRLKTKGYTWASFVESQINIAKAEVAMGKYYSAKGRLMKSLDKSVAEENGVLELRAVQELMKVNRLTKDYEKAFLYAVRYHELNDRLYGESQKEEAIRLNSMFKYEKIRMADSLKTAERDVMNEMMWAKEKENSQIIKYSLIIALLLTFGILGLIYRNFSNNKKQSAIILQQKTDVELQQIEIQQQHQELSKSHKEITDSINYSKRLQEAILPSLTDVDEAFPENFVYYQPKDVVSGDFYWLERKEETVFIAVADCTGHGVPGAMVSVVCSNALNQAVNEYHLLEPNEILNKTREIVIETFSKSGNDVQDGMDIALFALRKNKMIFAGANSIAYLVRKSSNLTDEQKNDKSTLTLDSKSLLQLKGDKQSVGLTVSMKNFKQIEIELEKGDQLYLFSDGYADQFGGNNSEARNKGGKKFKYLPFRKMILKNAHLSMTQQNNIIDQKFTEWKNDLEQVDDVCVIGVRV